MLDESKIFAEHFDECCMNAYSKSAYDKIKDDTEYINACIKCKELYNEIKEKLGDNHSLIDEFDAAKNFALGFDSKFVYQQGFRDCTYLLGWIGLI